MGQTTPGYASALLKNDDHFYFFDSHSRDESGMVSADGTACISQHENVTELCKFIECLALSLNIPNALFEIAKVTLPPSPIVYCFSSSDSESSLSCFEDPSDGEYTCKLYLGEEYVNKLKERNEDISDVSDIDLTSQYSEANAIVDQIDQCLTHLDDSSVIFNEINCSLFDKSFSDPVTNMHDNIKENTNVIDEAKGTSDNAMVTAFDSCSDYTDSNDGNYIPGEESDYSSDDYLPLSTFCVSKKQAQNKKTNNSKPGSPLADLKNHRVVNDNCQADKGETADTVNQYVCSSSNATQLTARTPSKAAVCSVPNFASRKRSRKAKPETWQRNVRKHQLNSGKSYMGKDNKLGSPKQEGHDGPVSLHWLIRESIHSKHYITWELV